MLEAKSTAQTILRSCSLPLLAIVGIIVNIAEITVAGMVLASIAMLINHNLQFFQEHRSLVILFVHLTIFLVLALPGFFTVIFLSKLVEPNRKSAAIILAIAGTLVCLSWGRFWFMGCGKSLTDWIVLLGLISGAIGQVWAAILIRRKRTEKIS
jgi:hypothetical protein